MKGFKKVLLGAGILFGVLILCGIGAVLAVSSTNAQKGNHEEVLKSTLPSPKKALVVYQPSLTSLTGDVAHQIARGLNDGGMEVTLNNPGDHMPADLSQYSVVVFGSPVYAGKISNALTGYMEKATGLSHCKVAIYSTGSAMGKQPELDGTDKLLGGASIYKKVKFSAIDKAESGTAAYELGAELAK